MLHSESARVEALRLLRPDWTDVEHIHWQYLPGGYANDNYAFDYQGARWVLRIPAPDSQIDRHFEQTYYQKLPKTLGVTPEAFDTETGAMLTPWVAGKLLVDAWSESELGLEELAGYLQQLHKSLPKLEQTYQTASASPLDREGYVPCHNDLNPWNIIIADDGTWRTLDWEWVGLNDPLFDLVSLHQGLELDEGLTELVDLYLQNRIENQATRLAWAYLTFWQRELDWAVNEIAKGNERQEILEQRNTAQEKLNSGPTT